MAKQEKAKQEPSISNTNSTFFAKQDKDRNMQKINITDTITNAKHWTDESTESSSEDGVVFVNGIIPDYAGYLGAVVQ